MTPTGFATYQTVTANTVVSQEEILLKLYEGLLQFLTFARRGIENGSPAKRGENISKALKIINELACSLDMEAGGEIAQNLSALYGYMTQRLTRANTKNDLEALEEVERLCLQLKQGFEQARRGGLQPPQLSLANSPELQEEGLQIAI